MAKDKSEKKEKKSKSKTEAGEEGVADVSMVAGDISMADAEPEVSCARSSFFCLKLTAVFVWYTHIVPQKVQERKGRGCRQPGRSVTYRTTSRAKEVTEKVA